MPAIRRCWRADLPRIWGTAQVRTSSSHRHLPSRRCFQTSAGVKPAPWYEALVLVGERRTAAKSCLFAHSIAGRFERAALSLALEERDGGVMSKQGFSNLFKGCCHVQSFRRPDERAESAALEVGHMGRVICRMAAAPSGTNCRLLRRRRDPRRRARPR